MRYLERFGQGSDTIWLSYPNIADAVHDISSGDGILHLTPLPGSGVYDADGVNRTAIAEVNIPVSGDLMADTDQALDDLYVLLLKQTNRSDRLYRRMPNGDVHYCFARLASVKAINNVDLGPLHLPVSLQFVKLSPTWYSDFHGGYRVLDAGVYLDTGRVLDQDFGVVYSLSNGTFTFHNGGTADVTAVQFLIQLSGGYTLDAVTITTDNGAAWKYQAHLTRVLDDGYILDDGFYLWNSDAGQVLPSTTLVIDSGAWAVTNNNVDAYTYFALDTGHVLDRWLELPAGDTDITITLTGTGSLANCLLVLRYADGEY